MPVVISRSVVPIAYKNKVDVPCTLRNYVSRDQAINSTVAEAMLATCASPPVFMSTRINQDPGSLECISGDLVPANVTREIIAKISRAFGDESTVACLVSIGSGNHRAGDVPIGNSESIPLVEFYARVAIESEKMAREIDVQTSKLTLYHRFSVDRELKSYQPHLWGDLQIITTRTTAYLQDLGVVKRLGRCVNTITTGYGATTLEELSEA